MLLNLQELIGIMDFFSSPSSCNDTFIALYVYICRNPHEDYYGAGNVIVMEKVFDVSSLGFDGQF